MKFKKFSMLLLAGSASVFSASSAVAGDVEDAVNAACNGLNDTGEASCGAEAQKAASGTNIHEALDGLWHVFDEVDVRTVKIRNGQTGAMDSYRMVLVRDTGIRGETLTDAAYTREYGGTSATVAGQSTPAATCVGTGTGEVYQIIGQ